MSPFATRRRRSVAANSWLRGLPSVFSVLLGGPPPPSVLPDFNSLSVALCFHRFLLRVAHSSWCGRAFGIGCIVLGSSLSVGLRGEPGLDFPHKPGGSSPGCRLAIGFFTLSTCLHSFLA